jgi:hypothetical protein
MNIGKNLDLKLKVSEINHFFFFFFLKKIFKIKKICQKKNKKYFIF